MTTINNIEDLIRLLDEHPEWAEVLRARLLTRELLELPAVLARFIQETNERFDRVERRLDHLEADVAELKTDVAELKTDVAELKTDVAELKTDVAELKTDVAELKTDVAELKTDVSYLKGNALETTLHRKIIPRLSQTLGLRQAEIKVSPLQGIEPEFRDAIEDGVDNGTISEQQMGRVFETDFILRAVRRQTRTPLWITVEASHKVHERDITRSVDTAEILARVFQETAAPMVVGFEIDPQDARRANVAGAVYLEIAPD